MIFFNLIDFFNVLIYFFKNDENHVFPHCLFLSI